MESGIITVNMGFGNKGQLTYWLANPSKETNKISSSGKAITIPITSGRIGITDQRLKGQGPIPRGNYWIDPKEISGGYIKALKWNLMDGDWGLYRTPLHPEMGTQTYGRDGFFLHGGNLPGSAGCIDVGEFDETIFYILKEEKTKVKVTVHYPGIDTIKSTNPYRLYA